MVRYVLMVLVGAASFGILSSFVKLAYRQGYTTPEVSFIQALLGAIVLWTIVFFTKKESRKPKEIGWLLFTGASIGMTTFLYYLSVKYIPASIAIVLLMQFTWIGILLEWILYGKKPLKMELIVTAVVIFGTLLASGIDFNQSNSLSIKGVGFVLLASLIYSIYIILNSKTGKEGNWQNRSAWIMTGSALSILILNFQPLIFSNHLDFHLLKWGLFLSVFGTILPPALFAVAIPKVGVTTSGLLMTVELPVAVLTANLVLGENITFVQIIGILIMIAAIIVMNLKKEKPLNKNKEELDSYV